MIYNKFNLKLHLFFVLLVLALPDLYSQPYLEWVKGAGDAATDRGYSIAVDASGNSYSTGVFRNTYDFDPNGGSSFTSLGSNDIYIRKLDVNGNLVWVKQIGGTGSDVPYTIALDASGNVYTVGYFEETVDFDPSGGVFNLSVTTVDNSDAFIVKLDASGNFVWAKKIGGTGNVYCRSIAIDVNGNVCLTGSFSGVTDFDPNGGVTNLTSSSVADIFVCKLDANGNLVWAKSAEGGRFSDHGISIDVDATGAIYTTGKYELTVDFDPGAGTYDLTSTNASYGADIFIWKLDASGNFVWAKSFGQGDITNSNDEGYSIAVDGSNNVYITGKFYLTVDFDPGAGVNNLTSAGNTDIFLLKLNSSGIFLWAHRFGGASGEYAHSVAVDASDNVYIFGDQYSPSVDFNPATGSGPSNVYNLVNTGTEANFIAKYDQNGDFSCALIIEPGHNETEKNRQIAIQGSNVYVTGDFDNSTSDFDPCLPNISLSSTTTYVAKYNFSVCDCSIPLAINLSSFTVSKSQETVITEWNISTNENISSFEVLRSYDGKIFTNIGKIEPNESNSTTSYSFTDKQPLSGLSYYKLKSIDNDDAADFSKIESINFEDYGIVKLYPNPAKNSINLMIKSLEESTAEIRIVNSVGQIVSVKKMRLNLGSNTITLPIRNLPKGIYIAKMSTSEKVFIQQFVKD